MNRIRHHRVRRRLSLLAMLALLWSQCVLALHPPCTLAGMDAAQAEVEAGSGCHDAHDRSDQAVCAAHCAQDEASPDSARVMTLPALLPALPVPVAALRCLSPHIDSLATAAPAARWHLPTQHPAGILLR